MSTSIVEVTAQFNNKSAKFCTLILNSIYFKNEGCFHDFNDINEIFILVSLKNMKFLQNVLQRYTIIPEFFENFKSIRSVFSLGR
jgi:hypothetical protein